MSTQTIGVKVRNVGVPTDKGPTDPLLAFCAPNPQAAPFAGILAPEQRPLKGRVVLEGRLLPLTTFLASADCGVVRDGVQLQPARCHAAQQH